MNRIVHFSKDTFIYAGLKLVSFMILWAPTLVAQECTPQSCMSCVTIAIPEVEYACFEHVDASRVLCCVPFSDNNELN
jgi:hypothetical protein